MSSWSPKRTPHPKVVRGEASQNSTASSGKRSRSLDDASQSDIQEGASECESAAARDQTNTAYEGIKHDLYLLGALRRSFWLMRAAWFLLATLFLITHAWALIVPLVVLPAAEFLCRAILLNTSPKVRDAARRLGLLLGGRYRRKMRFKATVGDIEEDVGMVKVYLPLESVWRPFEIAMLHEAQIAYKGAMAWINVGLLQDRKTVDVWFRKRRGDRKQRRAQRALQKHAKRFQKQLLREAL